MPYRLDPSDGRCVEVQREAGWERLKCHPTREAAARHLTALRINVDKTTEIRGSFQKFNDEQRIAFGLASVVHGPDGELIEDAHGDLLEADSLEKAVYEFNLFSRDADVMHVERGIGLLVESMVITPEKFAAIGESLDLDMPADPPVAWWVGFKVFDEEVWKAIKAGVLPMFSITGEGERTEIAA